MMRRLVFFLALVLLGCGGTPLLAQEGVKPEAETPSAVQGDAVPAPDAATEPLPVDHYSESEWSIGHVFRGLLGIVALLGLAALMSENKRKLPWRLILGAVGMQIIFGLCLIRIDLGRDAFQWLSDQVTKLLSYSDKGASFVFGDIVTSQANGAALAFRALPTIIFFSCLMSVLYHLRVMHYAIWILARIMNRFLGVTGSESMAMAANVFVGQTEAPLVIRRFVPGMTRSELMSLMVGGFATVAGSVLAAYIGFLRDAGGEMYTPHLLIASVMSAPAAFAISKIIVPETQTSETGAAMEAKFKPAHDNVLDAAASGTSDGLKLWLNVFAMLLAFTAMVFLINAMLGWVGERIHLEHLTLESILGYIFAPVAFLMGVPWGESTQFGSLLGIKVGVNEFIAYLELQNMIKASAAGEAGALSHRSLFMATYALCGFANFASIGIQIGGIAPLAPERRGEIIALALKAMLGGALASWMTASVAGMFF